MGEAACDARLMTFLTCVRAVRDQTPGGFAAVKLTALGDPVLLSQITTCAHVSRRFRIPRCVVAAETCLVVVRVDGAGAGTCQEGMPSLRSVLLVMK